MCVRWYWRPWLNHSLPAFRRGRVPAYRSKCDRCTGALGWISLPALAGEGPCQLMGAGAGSLSFARGRVVHRMGRSMAWGVCAFFFSFGGPPVWCQTSVRRPVALRSMAGWDGGPSLPQLLCKVKYIVYCVDVALRSGHGRGFSCDGSLYSVALMLIS